MIADWAVKNRITVLVLTVLLTIWGFYAYFSVPKEAQPSIKIPNIFVTVIYPGVSPDDVESLVAQPLEREIQSISGIKEMRVTAGEGVASLNIQFEPNVAIEDAYQKVRDRVNIAKPKLPSDIQEPIVREINISELPVITVNLAAGYSLSKLKDVADKLKDEFEGVPGVLEVELIGALEREMQINVDLAKLQSYNLSFQDVAGAIQGENLTIPGGSVDVDRLNYLVRVNGELKSEAQLENLIVKVPEPQGPIARPSPIYLRDVAEVSYGFKDRTTYSRLRIVHPDEGGIGGTVKSKDGKPLQVISLQVKKRSGANIIETVDGLKAKIATANMPSGTFVVYTGDNSEFVRNLVEELQNNLVAGIFFVVMALVFFLGIRASMLVAISIPLSMLMSFAVFQIMGLTLNFIVLFSLIIALGLLADNAIVVVENIYRFREMGYEKFEAARLATREVTGPVIYATLTTLAAFFPMLFWPGVIGKFMSYLPLTLIITLSTSLFVALVMNPVITAYLVRLDNEPKAIPPKWINYVTIIAVISLTILVLIINWVTVPVLIGMGLLVFAFTRYFLVPVSDLIINKQFPRYLKKYEGWLQVMMQRDYQVKRALLRNTFTLTSFTLGFILLILGSLLNFGEPHYGGFTLAQVVFMAPAAIIFVIGILGIFVHTFEIMIRGGYKTLSLSWKTALVMLAVFGIAWLRTDFTKPDATDQLVKTAISLSITPILMLLFGFIGIFLKAQRPLILTDNRAIVLNLTFGLFFGIFMIYAIAPTGVAFFPSTDPRLVTVNLEGGIGTNVQTSNKIAQKAETKIERLITKDPLVAENIKNYQTGVGTAGGQAAFFGGGGSPQVSFITINMVDYGDRGESSKNTLAKLREVVRSIPGALLKFTAPSNGPPTGAPVNIEVSGPDFNEIVRISHDIKLKLSRASDSKQIDGLVDVRDNLNSGRPEVRVKIDRERAQQYKLSTGQIASTIRSAINGTEASKFRDGEDEYDITVRLRSEDRNALESIQNLTLPVNVGGNPNNRRQLPLSAVASLELGTGFGSITRLDGRRVVTVSGDAAPGYSGPEVLGKVTTYLKDYKVKKGYALNFTGENKDQQESFGFLSIALFMGVGLIFLLLVMEFRNVRGPLVIMIGMGLSLIGVMLGLILTRSPFGLMTFIALISLSGLVVNHTIVLIDFALKREEEGESSQEAIIEAGVIRTRPIFLTIITSVIGLLPLVFGLNIDFVGLFTHADPGFQFGSENGQFWLPMNVALISGSIFSIFLTLYVAPVMYNAFTSIANRVVGGFKVKEDAEPFQPTGLGGDGASGINLVRPIQDHSH